MRILLFARTYARVLPTPRRFMLVHDYMNVWMCACNKKSMSAHNIWRKNPAYRTQEYIQGIAGIPLPNTKCRMPWTGRPMWHQGKCWNPFMRILPPQSMDQAMQSHEHHCTLTLHAQLQQVKGQVQPKPPRGKPKANHAPSKVSHNFSKCQTWMILWSGQKKRI